MNAKIEQPISIFRGPLDTHLRQAVHCITGRGRYEIWSKENRRKKLERMFRELTDNKQGIYSQHLSNQEPEIVMQWYCQVANLLEVFGEGKKARILREHYEARFHNYPKLFEIAPWSYTVKKERINNNMQNDFL